MKRSKEIFTISLGRNIRKYRTLNGLTVEQLALNAGLSYSQVSRIELGKISTSAFMVFILSKNLNVNPAKLYEIQ
jgi:transcriptional regulator with XRE-family HTH domain